MNSRDNNLELTQSVIDALQAEVERVGKTQGLYVQSDGQVVGKGINPDNYKSSTDKKKAKIYDASERMKMILVTIRKFQVLNTETNLRETEALAPENLTSLLDRLRRDNYIASSDSKSNIDKIIKSVPEKAKKIEKDNKHVTGDKKQEVIRLLTAEIERLEGKYGDALSLLEKRGAELEEGFVAKKPGKKTAEKDRKAGIGADRVRAISAFTEKLKGGDISHKEMLAGLADLKTKMKSTGKGLFSREANVSSLTALDKAIDVVNEKKSFLARFRRG